jgi:hypothetical protein
VTDAATNQKPRNRWAILVAVVAFFSCCGYPTYYCVVEPWWGEVRVKRWKADLDENLPVGSSREQAEAWFASRGLKPNDLIGPDGRRAGLAATIPDGMPPVNGAIRIELGFDDNGAVRERIVYRVEYSL